MAVRQWHQFSTRNTGLLKPVKKLDREADLLKTCPADIPIPANTTFVSPSHHILIMLSSLAFVPAVYDYGHKNLPLFLFRGTGGMQQAIL